MKMECQLPNCQFHNHELWEVSKAQIEGTLAAGALNFLEFSFEVIVQAGRKVSIIKFQSRFEQKWDNCNNSNLCLNHPNVYVSHYIMYNIDI